MVKKLRIENCNLDDSDKIENDNICRLSKFNVPSRYLHFLFCRSSNILCYFFKNFKKD